MMTFGKNLRTLSILALATTCLVGCKTNTINSGATLPTSSSGSGGGPGGGGSNPFFITEFSPASGSIQALPSSINVRLNTAGFDIAVASVVSNYSIACGTAAAVQPTSALIVSDQVMLSMPSSLVPVAGTVCTVLVSANLKDNAGTFLQGNRSVSYTITVGGTTGGGGSDTNAPTGSVTLPLPNDRLYGTVSLAANASDVGTNASGVSRVEFVVDGAVVGFATTAPYTLAYNTAALANGTHSFSINVKDVAGNVASNLDSRSVKLSNYTVYNTAATGGSGGVSYTDSAPAGMNLSGINISYGTYVNQLTPVYKNAYGADATQNGQTYGTTVGTAAALSCPVNYRVIGVYGRSGGYIDSIGLACQQANSTQIYYTGIQGGSSGNFYQLWCPVDQFVTSVSLRAGAWLDQIQLTCK